MRDVTIIGGGIAGLATAYYLQREARKRNLPLGYTLLESGDRLGGKIVTEQVGGFTVEGGPDCFLGQKPWAADLCEELGLGGELMGTNEDRRKVFVVNRGRLTPLPDGVMLIVPTRIAPFVTSPLISWPGKLRMGLDVVIPRRRSNSDESVAEFVRRRLGQEALDKIAQPLLGGIHMSDPEQQSLLGTFPRFRDLEMKYGSMIRGMLAQRRRKAAGHGNGTVSQGNNGGGKAAARPSSMFITLRRGLGEMVDGVGAALEGQVITGARVTEVVRQDGHYRVCTANGDVFASRAVVLATPANVSGSLLWDIAPALATSLEAIRYVSTATVSLGFRRAEIEHDLRGSGIVIPRREQRKISACTWTSSKFDHRAPDGTVLLRCFVGGPGQEEMVDLPDEALVDAACDELAQLMGIHAQPILTRIYRWHKANPQYDVGHLDRVKEMQAMAAAVPGLYVTGGAFEGVGVPDCVRQGKRTAENAASFLCA